MKTVEYLSERKLKEYEVRQGYWYRKGKVYNVTDDEHVKFVIDNPSIFNYSKEEIEAFLSTFPNQNTAKEKLLELVAKDHWLRIRHWTTVISFWVVGCYSYKESKEDIKDFCYWALENKLMKIGQQLTIIGYDGTDEVFKTADKGIEKFLSENTNRVRRI